MAKKKEEDLDHPVVVATAGVVVDAETTLEEGETFDGDPEICADLVAANRAIYLQGGPGDMNKPKEAEALIAGRDALKAREKTEKSGRLANQ